MPGQLTHPPLVEALLEIRWQLDQIGPDTFHDPMYRLLIGRWYDRIRERFPSVQELPLAQAPIPDELTPYRVKQQFRAKKNGWPLVQLGPGVATLNFTSPYSWDMFDETARFVFPKLSEAYTRADPESEMSGLQLTRVMLRYINGVDFDWLDGDVLEFIEQRLHTTFNLPAKIREVGAICGVPRKLNLQAGYPLSEPPGEGVMRLSTGRKGQERGVIWELVVRSEEEDVPQLTDADDFWKWLSSAHDVIEAWFDAFIEGELEERFGRENGT